MKGFYHIWAWRPSWACDPMPRTNFRSPYLFFLSSDTESINFDHHLRCGGWLNFEFSEREKHSGWAIQTTLVPKEAPHKIWL